MGVQETGAWRRSLSPTVVKRLRQMLQDWSLNHCCVDAIRETKQIVSQTEKSKQKGDMEISQIYQGFARERLLLGVCIVQPYVEPHQAPPRLKPL